LHASRDSTRHPGTADAAGDRLRQGEAMTVRLLACVALALALLALATAAHAGPRCVERPLDRHALPIALMP
jgi:hypothetical protein